MHDDCGQQVPLIERLQSVPIDGRVMIEVGPTHHQNIPYGPLCHEAAAELATLRAEVARLTTKLDESRRDCISVGQATEDYVARLRSEQITTDNLRKDLAAAQNDADNWRRLWCENSARLSQPTEQATAQDPQTQSSAPAKP